MTMMQFTFANNLDSRTITVKGTTMRNAMHGAAMFLKLNTCNLIFLSMAEIRKAA